MDLLISQLLNKVSGIVEDAFRDPSVAAQSDRPGPAAREVAERVVRAEVAPVLEHVTNSEPWYRSRVTWGALISFATPLLGLAGVRVEPGDAESITSLVLGLGPVIGAVVTLYGRWVASRPLGR